MTPIKDIENKLTCIRSYMLKDLKAKKLVYNYYILQKKEVFLDLNKLDFHFTKYKHNINVEKLTTVIKLAHSTLFLWNEKFTNDMIAEDERGFYYGRDKNHKNPFAFNTSVAFRGISETSQGKFVSVFDWGINKRSEKHEDRKIERIKKIFDGHEKIYNTSIYDIVVDCVKLINLIQIEYPDFKVEDYEVKCFEDGKFEYNNNSNLNYNRVREGGVRISAKHYALYHWVLISLGIEKHFERNEYDKFSKVEIENFAQERYKEVSSQMFYRSFIDIDITNKTVIANSFGKGYKDIVISLSNNNSKVIKHLKTFPN